MECEVSCSHGARAVINIVQIQVRELATRYCHQQTGNLAFNRPECL